MLSVTGRKTSGSRSQIPDPSRPHLHAVGLIPTKLFPSCRSVCQYGIWRDGNLERASR